MLNINPFHGILNGLLAGDNQLGNLSDSLVLIMLAAVVLCFLTSEITRNYSQVDKLWSLMPAVYSITAYFAFPSPRLLIMSCLVLLWGIRLSWNFARKGGYNIVPWRGEEDYRWKIIQQHPLLKGRIRFGLFNLFFISFYQHLLIFLFSCPLLVAAKYSNTDLTFIDITAAMLMLLFIILEAIADNQQFSFRRMRKMAGEEGGDPEGSFRKGFVTSGLWKYARHPNFAAEQAIWICFYLFGVGASGEWINWTISGAVLLVLLFQGSTLLTESISSKKYPDYAEYIRNVPKFIPVIFRFRRNRKSG